LIGIIETLIQPGIELPKILNISNSNPKSALEMIRLIDLNLNSKSKIKIVPRSDAEAETTIGSQLLLNKTIGDWDWIPLDLTVKNFVEWYSEFSHQVN
jgi:hypothetical protein